MKERKSSFTVRPNLEPWVQAHQPWFGMPGYGYGLTGPALIGTIRVRVPEAWRLEKARSEISLRMQSFHGEPSGESRPSLFLIDSLLRWVDALQAFHRLQSLDRAKVLSSSRINDNSTDYRVALPGYQIPATNQILAAVLSQIHECLTGKQNDPNALPRLQKTLSDYSHSPLNVLRFLKAARELNIPVRHLAGNTFSYGNGNRRRLLNSTFTDETSVIGVELANFKNLTAQALRRAGLPGTTHILVADEEQALRAARKIGYPVVVKPLNAEQGLGVAAGLASDEAVVKAYRNCIQACRTSKVPLGGVLIEKHAPGRDYRLTVFHGRVVNAFNRIPGGVVGDGTQSIEELMKQTSEDPQQARRSHERGRILLELDAEALELLEEKGMTPQSIPALSEFIPLRRRANISAGGSSVAVPLDAIHEDNRLLAERAAAVMALDLAGIDLLIEDISQSWHHIGGVICEVNAQPQLGLSTSPGIYRDILKELLPGESRIPCVLVVSGTGVVDWDCIRKIGSHNEKLGVATAEEAWIGKRRIALRPDSSYRAGIALFFDPGVSAAIVVMSITDIARFGLPADRFDLVLFDGAGHWTTKERKAAGDVISLLSPHALAFAELCSHNLCLESRLDTERLVFHEKSDIAGSWTALEGRLRDILARHKGLTAV